MKDDRFRPSHRTLSVQRGRVATAVPEQSLVDKQCVICFLLCA